MTIFLALLSYNDKKKRRCFCPQKNDQKRFNEIISGRLSYFVEIRGIEPLTF